MSAARCAAASPETMVNFSRVVFAAHRQAFPNAPVRNAAAIERALLHDAPPTLCSNQVFIPSALLAMVRDLDSLTPQQWAHVAFFFE